MAEDENVLGVRVGDVVTFSKTVTDADVVDFARISGDTNPLHLDDAYAARTRFKQRIAHGVLSIAVISAAVGTKLAPHATVVYLNQTVRFQRPVHIGETITARCEVTRVQPGLRFVTLKTDVLNTAGELVVTGEGMVLLDEIRA